AFEVTCNSLEGAIKVIGGGGRFDGVVEQIVGPATPAVGFGSGMERVLLALESQNIDIVRDERPRVRMAYFDDESKLEAFALARKLRLAGIEADFAYRSRSLPKQLQAAGKQGFRFIVIV